MAFAGEMKSQKGEIKEEEEEATGEQFPRFDVVTDDSDHRYATMNKNKGGGDCFTKASSGVHKKIMKEWKILEQNLPDLVYVRVYERRIDLLRAVIVGSPGTPYYGGLFLFDFAFPPDYPTRPPQVQYHSFGLRLNPNLYSNGYVCLSLLNTWMGKKKERWNPSESTILQVLVSIQGLVLNQKPYFNEPGVGAFPGRAKRSAEYNENVYVLSCQTMVYLLRRPPKNFENFVNWHFKKNARDILTHCNAYRNGIVRVGNYSCANNESISTSSSIKVSSNFKDTMKQWYPKLVDAFGKTGASVGDFAERLRVKNETTSFKPVIGKTSNKSASETTSSKPLGIKNNRKYGFKEVIGKIKKILGLKKDGKGNADKIMVKASLT